MKKAMFKISRGDSIAVTSNSKYEKSRKETLIGCAAKHTILKADGDLKFETHFQSSFATTH
jgi:hypothetical protein